jgi:hypothetical protein
MIFAENEFSENCHSEIYDADESDMEVMGRTNWVFAPICNLKSVVVCFISMASSISERVLSKGARMK